MKKWVLVIAGTLGVCVAIAAVLSNLLARPRLSEEQFESIQVGQTLADVEDILGCKPGDYSAAEFALIPLDMQFQAEEKQERRESYCEWAADYPTSAPENANDPSRQRALAIRVWFDEDGKVIDKCRMGYDYAIPSTASRVMRRVAYWLTLPSQR